MPARPRNERHARAAAALLRYQGRLPDLRAGGHRREPRRARLHRDDIVITSVDGSPDAVEALKTKTLLAGTASQSPREQGRLGVETGYNIMNGKAPEVKVRMLPPSSSPATTSASTRAGNRSNVERPKGMSIPFGRLTHRQVGRRSFAQERSAKSTPQARRHWNGRNRPMDAGRTAA